MIMEDAVKKCKKCGREHNAPGTICFICMNEAINPSVGVPRRVGIARKGDVVILEALTEQSQEEKCRIANLLGDVRTETGVRFLVLDAKFLRLARIADENDQKELAAWREKWNGFFYEPTLGRVVTKGEDGEIIG